MNNATEFSLDIQKLAAEGQLNPTTFRAAIDRFGGEKQADGSLLFNDDSVATWVEEQQAFCVSE